MNCRVPMFILRNKMNSGVRFVICFLRVPLVPQPYCLVPCFQSNLGNLLKLLAKPTVQLIYFDGSFTQVKTKPH